MTEEKPTVGTGGLDSKAASTSYDSACAIDSQACAPYLSEDHRDQLRTSAITDAVIDSCGVYTAACADDLPECLRHYAKHKGVFPALVFPMVEADGAQTFQMKPAQPIPSADGKLMKYVSPAKSSGVMSPKLPVVRGIVPGMTRRVVIAEGTKQALAVDSYADTDVAVLRIAGIYGWKDAVSGPTTHLDIVAGYEVIIIPDADAASNAMVYDGALALGKACELSGATSVRYARLLGAGKAGIDDLLQLRDVKTRPVYLRNVLQTADKRPADQRPRTNLTEQEGKRWIDLSLGAASTIRELDEALLEEFKGDGDKLPALYRGDKGFVRVSGVDGNVTMSALETGDLVRFIASSCFPYRPDKDGRPQEQEISDKTFRAVMKGYEPFPEIRGVTTVPIVHPDGTIVTKPGYDPVTKLYVNLADELVDLYVPDDPTDEDIENARNWILKPLVDFAFKEESDRMRAIAACMTPMIRPIVPTSPIFTLNGISEGIGKGKLLGVFSLINFGTEAVMSVFTESEEEMRKKLTSDLMAGRSHIVLDEVTEDLYSRVLNAFVTSSTWSDRELRTNNTPTLHNKATVYATGNNLAFSADVGRRTLLINLYYEGNPTQRTDFEIDDLEGFTLEHRRELMAAYLTLIRAWYKRGKPLGTSGFKMASFEQWQRIIEGVMEMAGFNGLFDHVLEQRLENDTAEMEWRAHFEWLSDNGFGLKPFTSGDVCRSMMKAKYEREDVYPPYDSPIEISPAQLTRLYKRAKGRWRGDFRIVLVSNARGRANFQLEHISQTISMPLVRPEIGELKPIGVHPDAQVEQAQEVEVAAGDQLPVTHMGVPASVIGPVEPAPCSVQGPRFMSWEDYFGLTASMAEGTDEAPVRFEAAQAELYEGAIVDIDGTREGLQVVYFMLNPDGSASYTTVGNPVKTVDIPSLVAVLEGADRLVTYDFFGDTARVLAAHGFDVGSAIDQGRVRDVLVLARQCDPPAQGRGYDVAALVRRYGLTGKTDMEQLKQLYWTLACDEYAVEEHQRLYRVSVANGTGVSVNVEEANYVAEHAAARRENVAQMLSTKYGVTTVRSDGKASQMPWATVAGKRQIADLLLRFGVVVPTNTTGEPSLRREFLLDVAGNDAAHPEARDIAHRIAEAMEVPAAANLLSHIDAEGVVRPEVKPEQSTGRFSTTAPALNVFGKRDARLLAQRSVILPDSEDEVLIAFDFAQIDARVMAVGSQDEAYLAHFAPGVDYYTSLAEQLWADPSRRADAKKVAHAINYGAGPNRLSQDIGIPLAETQALLGDIAKRYPKLDEFKTQLRQIAKRDGFITTGFGRRVRVNENNVYTQAPAAYGQGTARDVFTTALMKMPMEVVERIRIFAHDEIVLSAPKDKADEYRNAVLEAMTFEFIPPTLLDASDSVVSVSVIADASNPGDNWAKCYAD
ncbi:DNA polymerase [Corynebacterium sp. ACRQP]|uniref:DNA polymerase n=1 Tax=Corynebacterium sp. ACRQP TaxID=2918195 RepID=UPI001EF66F42|nr:DNA polymerase [Corynebacterium sp. ACRQP]MCG7236096.1 DNA polymerase [Corynebacterium sp. ACRQP]